MVGGGGTSLAVVVVWLSKDAWFAIVDTFLFPATKALSDPNGVRLARNYECDDSRGRGVR